MKVIFLCAVLFLTACSVEKEPTGSTTSSSSPTTVYTCEEMNANNPERCRQSWSNYQQAQGTATSTSSSNGETPSTVSLSGYVVSAWDVVVDGESYTDTEDYYTQQLEALHGMAEEEGYRGWDISFDAQIGLTDLKFGMKVFVVSGTTRGYAAEARVDSEGSFKISFPYDSEALYKIRAMKRVSVTLTDPETKEWKKWCYILSAVEQEVSLMDDERPVLLSNFVTQTTTYECESSGNTGITIPSSGSGASSQPKPKK